MGTGLKIGLCAFAAAICGAASAAAACAEDIVTISGDFGQAQFRVDIADEPEERSRGLMFVEEMPRFAGMLFIYDAPQFASFWMRNTLIPLDMLFVGPDGTIKTLHENAIPLDETSIIGGDGISHVLEINGGMSARLGIDVGDTLQHPSFGADAANPCEIE